MKYFFESKEKIEMNERDTLDFPPHLHEYIEIGYLERGTTVLVVEDKKYSLRKGNFFVVFPNQIHSYEASQNIIVKLIIFSPQLIVEFENMFSSKIPQSPVVFCDTDSEKVLRLLFDIKTDNKNILKGELMALFGLLTDKMTFMDIDKYNVSTLKNLLIYCSEHFSDGITVEDASDSLHISRYHIAHIFREKLHTTFSDYLTEKRVEYACRLLRDESLTVTEIAFQSGFNSLRSFNRNFLKYKHISPKAYRKTNKSQTD